MKEGLGGAEPPAPRLPRFVGVLVEIAVAVAITLALILGVDAAAGWFIGSQGAHGDFVDTALKTMSTNPAPLVPDHELLWRNQAGAERDVPTNPKVFGRPETWHVAINREAYRGPERPSVGAGASVYRVLCVGDSITYGYNTDQDDVFPRRLEAALREAHPGRAIDVINAGVPGWSWLQGLRFLEREGLALHPDVVVMGHGTNDQGWGTLTTDLENLGGVIGLENLGNASAWSRAVFRVSDLLTETNTVRAIRLLRGRTLGPQGRSRACRQQAIEAPSSDGTCNRVSLGEIEAAVRETWHLTSREGIDLVLINVDFARTHAVTASRAVAEAEGLHFVDFVGRFDELRATREETRRAHFGLAPGGPLPPTGEVGSGTHRLLLRVHVDVGATSVGVQGQDHSDERFEFNQPMFDDGTHGDEVAGDRVYSTTIAVPVGVGRIEYKFARNAEMEFTPLPPLRSRMGVRLREVADDTLAPVEEFGELSYLAEQAHPDREGHAVIASALAAEVEQLPSFRRSLDHPVPRDASLR